MAIRQRTWVSGGKEKSAWVVEYFDSARKWRLKTFKTKKEAQEFESTTRVDLRQGRHIPDRDSITIAEAGKLWLETCEEEKLVWSTLKGYREHLNLHIKPFIGDVKLSRLDVGEVSKFRSKLLAAGRSRPMVNKIVASLGALIADAMLRKVAVHNPVRDLVKRKKGKRKSKAERTADGKRKLVVGVDIPLPFEIRDIINAATGYDRAFFITASLTGLRASELRALRWEDVDLAMAVITIAQMADKQGTIDIPKSESSERTLPIGPMVVNALREWKLACPRRDTGKKDAADEPIMELHYVFPNNKGNVQIHENIVRRHWWPLQVAAGLGVPKLYKRGPKKGTPVMEPDENGKLAPVVGGKYAGLHALRHYYASWCAARPQDGGLGLPLKTVQHRLGHSTLAMTADTYGHLFPSTDDAEALAAGELALMRA